MPSVDLTITIFRKKNYAPTFRHNWEVYAISMLYVVCDMICVVHVTLYMSYVIRYMLYVICDLLSVICYLLYVICYMLYVINFILGDEALQCYMLYVICYMLYGIQISMVTSRKRWSMSHLDPSGRWISPTIWWSPVLKCTMTLWWKRLWAVPWHKSSPGMGSHHMQ